MLYIRKLKISLQKAVAPVLKTIRSPPDYIEDYKQDYGYIGPALCTTVAKARTASTQLATLATTAATTTALTTNQQQSLNCTGKTLMQTGKPTVIGEVSCIT